MKDVVLENAVKKIQEGKCPYIVFYSNGQNLNLLTGTSSIEEMQELIKKIYKMTKGALNEV